jgi:glycosyltransferase involved in cell wall biosynthesis
MPAGSDPRRRVLFVSHEAVWGGAQKVLYSLVKGLDHEIWQPIVVLPEHGALERALKALGVTTVVTPLEWAVADIESSGPQFERFSRDLLARTNRIVDIIDREQVSLVVTNTLVVFEGALAARLTGVPHIWYIHELLSQDAELRPILDYPAFHATVDALSDKLVVISEAVRDEVLQFFPSTPKIELIYTGLEDSAQLATPDKRRTLGIPSDMPVISCIGAISERKGVASLPDVAEIVVRSFPRAKFVVVGDAVHGLGATIRARIKQKDLENNFEFLGFRDDVSEILACTDVVAVPSVAEPFSLVALEAMQAGKPVVATRSGGPQEILVDGETGFLVPVNDPYEMAQAVIRLLQDDALRKSMGEKGRQRLEQQFGYDEYLGRFEALFAEVTSQTNAAVGSHDTTVVDNLIGLAAVSARTHLDRAELVHKEDPVAVVRQLLNYDGYIPYDIPPVLNAGPRPKLSVCIPVYNGARYIRASIDSVLAQSFTDYELIVVDDASGDDSEKVIKSCKDPRIQYVANSRNLGLIGNWNTCLRLARGEYVCVFHQDDLMDVENLERKVALLDSEASVGLAYSDTSIVDQRGKTTSNHWFNLIDPNVDFKREGRDYFDLLFHNLNIVCCPSVVARRECYEKLGGFDSRLPLAGDLEMWLRIALFYDVAYISEPLMRYRWHDSNLTRRYLDLDLIQVYLAKRMSLDKYPGRFSGSPYEARLVDDTTRRVFERALHHCHQQEYKLAKQYLVFLQLVRQASKEPSLIDSYIGELLASVDQANALRWIGRGRKDSSQASRS